MTFPLIQNYKLGLTKPPLQTVYFTRDLIKIYNVDMKFRSDYKEKKQ